MSTHASHCKRFFSTAEAVATPYVRTKADAALLLRFRLHSPFADGTEHQRNPLIGIVPPRSIKPARKLDPSKAAGRSRRQCEEKLTLKAPLPNDYKGRIAVIEYPSRTTPPLRFLPLNFEGDD
jgi:hypothetical protein